MINYFYNIALKSDKCDFYSDVLTSVRKDYYLSKEKQKGKLTQDSSGDSVFYEFNLEQDKCMKWQISDSSKILSESKSSTDGKYVINYYNNVGLCKRLTFSKFHTLLQVEYFDVSRTQQPYCTIEPRKSDDGLCLLINSPTSYQSDALFSMPEIDDEYVLDKIDEEFDDYMVVASTNDGVVKFLSENQLELFNAFVAEALKNKEIDTAPKRFVDVSDTVLAQKLNPKDFNIKRNLSQVIDITDAKEFSFDIEDIIEEEEVVETEVEQGAVVVVEVEQELPAESADVNVVAFDEEVVEPENEEPRVEVCEEEETETQLQTFDDISDDNFVACEQEEPDLVIESSNSKYHYYGELDDNNKRCGFGRTTTIDGNTAYEGEYRDNKRSGFGAYYYKDGSLCYYGEWKDNMRQGFGIGVSSFDKSVHIGAFENNKPLGDGARVRCDGELDFVQKTLSNGVTVKIRFENDSVVVTKYNSNGEVISENTSNLNYF